jgi:hypothetical protein
LTIDAAWLADNIMAVWGNESLGYGARVAALVPILMPTLSKDSVVDSLYGQDDQDWFIVGSEDQTPDWGAGEEKTLI